MEEEAEPPALEEEYSDDEGIREAEPIPPAVVEYPPTDDEIPSLSIPPVPPPPPVITPIMKAPVIKVPIMKKIPIKLPPGMTKVPKMPGVVRMKIPKALHQMNAAIPPKPPEEK